jgi:hypothetical protein
MQRPEPTRAPDPLDLLRRFTPTPLKAVYRIGKIRVAVETNDFALLPRLHLEAEFDSSQRSNLEWKLVRDADVRAPLETPICLTTETLTVVAMGGACILGLDKERHELLGFIGAAVDGRTFQEFLLPHLIHMTKEVVSDNQDAGNTNRSKELLHG